MDMDNTQSTSAAPFSQGQVSLPNEGQILSTDKPDAQTDTQTKPEDQLEQAKTQAAPVPANISAPMGMPNDTGIGLPSKPPTVQGPQTTATQPTKPTVPPEVQKASRFREVAEALAGGPRYKYSVDAQGNMQKVPLPVSNSHLAMAIALEAISGAIGGLGQQGPNAEGKAAAQGFQIGKGLAQQQNDQSQTEAKEDFARRAQVTETNLRMYSMAKQIGKLDADANDSYIAQYKPMADKLQSEFPSYIQGPIKYSDFGKYNVTSDNAIPYSRVPRLDANGNQVSNANGVPQWDINYLIVDPKLKASGLLDDKTLDTLKEMGKPWAENPLLANSPMSLMMALNLKTQASQWNVGKNAVNNFFDTLDKATKEGQPSQANQGFLQAPDLKNEAVNKLVEDISNKYAGEVSDILPADSFTALVKGIAQQESGGNPAVQDSPKGAQGIMQLMPGTASQLGVTDAHNPAQNVEGGVKYFTSLLKQYKDPKLALAAYNAGPNNVQNEIPNFKETQNYVDSISKLVGLNNAQAQGQGAENKIETPNLAELVKTNPTLPADIEKFMSALASANGNYAQALSHLRSNPTTMQTASNITAMLGGPDNVRKVDNFNTIQMDQAKTDIQTKALEERQANKAKADEAVQARKQAMLNTLETADIPKPDQLFSMDPKDVVKNLHDQGVTLPAEAIRDAMTIAHYDAPLSTSSNKRWFKDAQLDQQELLDIVKQFNPSYDEKNYKNLGIYGNPNSKPAQTAFASAGVSNHLNMLLDAAQEIAQKGEGAGSLPMLNRLENALNYHTGGTAYVRLSGLTNAVNSEMGKVLSGGFAPDKSQVEALLKNMTPENSLNQIQALGKLYTDIMYGKIKPYDEAFNQQSAGLLHMTNIPESATKLFQRYNLETPWAKNKAQETSTGTKPNPNEARPNEVPVFVQGKIVGYTIAGKPGMRPVQ